MSAKTLQQRLNKVCRYIDDNLEYPLRLEQLARIAHCSPYHFQRQFKAHIGLNPAQYVQNKRLRRAMLQLANRPSLKVTDIAFEAGFDFVESFSHSFKRRFGVTPTEFRHQPNWDLWNDFIEQGAPKRMAIPDTTQHDVSVVDFPETQVAALEHHGSPSKIMESVETFIEWRRANGVLPPESKTYNIFYNDPEATAPDEFHMDICCTTDKPIKSNPQGVIHKTIAASSCAKIRFQGTEDQLRGVMDYLYGEWLEQSDYELVDKPPFFERVEFFPDRKEHEAVTDVYLPVRLRT
ncbi:AraC family transcriptional regulator [Kangiella shandongensis]|uniref:AraC family transcriptional regulator n=1 Tax=Kangiella shandongensis TaxID=2763258 RepID=UPI001CBF365C|nr:AraC family transcriptional regulator [Kangiella shandongensis]